MQCSGGLVKVAALTAAALVAAWNCHPCFGVVIWKFLWSVYNADIVRLKF